MKHLLASGCISQVTLDFKWRKRIIVPNPERFIFEPAGDTRLVVIHGRITVWKITTHILSRSFEQKFGDLPWCESMITVGPGVVIRRLVLDPEQLPTMLRVDQIYDRAEQDINSVRFYGIQSMVVESDIIKKVAAFIVVARRRENIA